MKILSIDVGIKNLAMCILKTKQLDDMSESMFCIEKWEVINLCSDDHACHWKTMEDCTSENKYLSQCNKKAFYTKNKEYYCKVHAKARHISYKIPPPELKNIATKKVYDILQFVKDYDIPYTKPTKKSTLLENIKNYYSEEYFDFVKTVSAKDINIVDIGIQINIKMGTFLESQNIDKIIIENQIGPLATRMKSIQGMITQYFVMKNHKDIEFINASNKLKLFTKEKMTYEERKKKSIEVTYDLLRKYQNHWISSFDISRKKDDLADSFLQGIWFLHKNEDLRINI